MASVSGAASSLGNTSLRGYGGFGSGIDRDSIIEQMTAGTQSKITNQKNKMTSLGWKQEAFQAVSDKMLALQDNYFSFASGTNLKYPSMFAKNQITAMGDSDITKFVSATGSSNMLDYLSILGVKQLASSSTLQSASKGTSSIHTGITQDSLTNPVYKSSLLQGRQLRFGTYSGDQYQSAGIFTFPSSYKDKDGDGKDITVPIDYTIDLDAAVEVDGVTMTGGEKLAMQLNKALSQSGIKSGEDSISDVMEFVYADGKMNLQTKAGKTTNLVINSSSSALTALGYNPQNADGTDKTVSDGISLSEFNENQKQLNDTYVNRQTMTQYLTGKKLTISFGGQTKEIELVKSGDTFADLDDLKGIIQGRLNQAFGTDNIKVAGGTRYGADGNPVIGTDGNPVIDPLSFELGSNASSNQTLTVTSDNAEIRNVLGIQKGASNKLNLEGSIRDNIDKLIPDGPDAEAKRAQFLNSLETDGLVINGVKISGVTADTSIQGMIDKINTNKDVGVKASYLSSTNQFVLISSETGSGREIQLEGASADIFGAVKDAAGNYTDGNFEMGKNAQVLVSYGNGISTMIESSSNTFDFEGLRVTVSQEFGNVTQDASGVWNSDRSKAVTFSAKADVDGVTETVKKFIEEYNEMIKEINTQVTTRPDKAYGPLTEEQKDEMSEKSIENWEKKAKQGLLYNDATMRALSLDMQGVLTNLMANGANYKDLEEMGITISDDYLDGGTITFDEAKFKAAMTSDPEKVSNVFTGGGDIKKGLASIIEDTLTPYATKYANRNGNSYGRLIEEAGSEKIPLSIMNNQIYKDLKEMQSVLDTLNARLASEQDRYISQFTTMETLINQMNSQASYLAQFQA
ncbi:flagellar filament capping protein FliD [Enterocloster bolteae]|uniref:flagellar filament capping protein FliD n=1 Tax=Enterocloster bolteae TaxID=208479 RepID=UPI001D0671B8|nr:flagellar filament capping protein FliD [Enterocloster bolteae]MCB6926473.1 flagellar filament capping protein FliD [Enterocloster bolteae]MCQ4755580.1 flagellar filament capping protein FliD [Enterocloster bolteae]